MLPTPPKEPHSSAPRSDHIPDEARRKWPILGEKKKRCLLDERLEFEAEPVAETKRRLCSCETEGGTCEGCKNCCCWPVWKLTLTFKGNKKLEEAGSSG